MATHGSEHQTFYTYLDTPVGTLLLAGCRDHGLRHISFQRGKGAKAPESPVVLLHNAPCWEAPLAFATSLAISLGHQTARKTLLINLGTGTD
ncbi:MAG: hypothetical protein AABY89_01115, partial [Acidobacteriota bacterium]